jgi:hypothetical protein
MKTVPFEEVVSQVPSPCPSFQRNMDPRPKQVTSGPASTQGPLSIALVNFSVIG